MESVNFIKGYGKVNPDPLDDQASKHHKAASHKRRTLALYSIFLLLLTVAIGGIIAAIIHNSTAEKHESIDSTLSSNQTQSIRIVCAVTRYPNSCFYSISTTFKNLPSKLDPEFIFTVSLHISMVEVKNLSSLPKTLLSKSNDPRSESALRDCATLFDDAVSQLNNSVSAMYVGIKEKALTEDKIRDLNTWISAAMTAEDTCLDGLEDMGSTTVLDEIRKKVQRSKEYMSNSLAILANMHSLLEKFGLPLH